MSPSIRPQTGVAAGVAARFVLLLPLWYRGEGTGTAPETTPPPALRQAFAGCMISFDFVSRCVKPGVSTSTSKRTATESLTWRTEGRPSRLAMPGPATWQTAAASKRKSENGVKKAVGERDRKAR